MFRFRVLKSINLAAILAAILFSDSLLAQQPETPRALLGRMAAAERELNYRGVFTYEHSGDLATLKVVHGVRNGEAYERLFHMDGDPREFVRRGNALDCLRTGDLLLRDQNDSSTAAGSFRLEDFYQLFPKGEGRVAGRRVQILHIVPRDAYRYGYIVAIDKTTGLMLQSILMNEAGKPLERFQFVDIKIGAMLEEADFMPSSAESLVVDVDSTGCGIAPDAGIGANGWRAQWIPPGFVLAAHQPENANGRESLLYTDGLTAFSVIVDSMLGESLPPVDARLGATVAVLKKLDIDGKPHAICVVGEIPHNTARQVVLGVQPALR